MAGRTQTNLGLKLDIINRYHGLPQQTWISSTDLPRHRNDVHLTANTEHNYQTSRAAALNKRKYLDFLGMEKMES